MSLVDKAAGTPWMRVLLQLTEKRKAATLTKKNRHVLHGNAGIYLGRFHLTTGTTRDGSLLQSDVRA